MVDTTIEERMANISTIKQYVDMWLGDSCEPYNGMTFAEFMNKIGITLTEREIRIAEDMAFVRRIVKDV